MLQYMQLRNSKDGNQSQLRWKPTLNYAITMETTLNLLIFRLLNLKTT